MKVQGPLLLVAVATVMFYILGHPLPARIPTGPAATGALALPLHEILFVLVLFLGMAGWGQGHRGPRPGIGPLTRLLEGLVLGTLGTTLVILVMGIAGFLDPGKLGLVGLAIAARAPVALAGLREAAGVIPRAWRMVSVAERCLILLLVVMILPASARALCPPTTWDALMYHLAGPAYWLAAGAIRPDAPVYLAHYPSASGMLYLLSMALTSDRAPGLIHFGFFLASIVAVGALGRRVIGDAGGLWAGLLYAGIPIVHRTAGDAVADQLLIFSTVMAMSAILRHLETQDVTDITQAGLAAGLACSAKYQGIHVSFALFVILYLGLRGRGSLDWRPFVRFITLGALVASPWYLKSLVFTGNPFHQAGNRGVHRFLSARGIDGGRLARLRNGHFSDHPDLEHLDYFSEWASYGRGYTPRDLVELPYWLSVDSHDAPDETSYSVYGGEATPLFLAFLPLLFVARPPARGARELWPFLVAGGLLFTIVAVQSHQCRYFMPTFAFFSIAAAAVPAARGRSGKVAALLAVAAWLWASSTTWSRSFTRGDFAAAAGLVTRDAYLAHELDHHAAFRFAREKLPPGSVLFLGFEPRVYHLGVPFRGGDPLGLILRESVLDSTTADEVVRKLRATGATHLYVPLRFITVLTTSNRDPALPARLKDLFGRALRLVYQDATGLIFEIPAA